MIRADVIKLVTENPEAHGVFETAVDTGQEVFAEIRSVTRSEAYAAKSAGLNPEYVFRLTDYADYNGQRKCTWNDVPYRIIRTYVDGQSIELTVEKEVP